MIPVPARFSVKKGAGACWSKATRRLSRNIWVFCDARHWPARRPWV